MCVSVVVEYADTRFSRVSLQKTKKFAKPFLPIHMGPRSNLLRKTKWSKLVTLSLLKAHTRGKMLVLNIEQ